MFKFKQSIKIFFEPVQGNWGFLIKPILRNLRTGIFVVFTIEVFKHATTYIQTNQFDLLQKLIFIYGIVVLFHILCGYFTRGVGWGVMTYDGLKLFQNLYMKKYFQLDNSKVETLGTGKIINIIDNGFKAWNDIYIDMTKTLPYVLVICIYSIYQILIFGGIVSILIFVAIILLIYIVSYLNEKCTYWREKRMEYEGDYLRQMVKMIMSKIEISQSNKVNQEINKTNEILTKTTNMNMKLNLFIWAMFESTNWLSHFFKIGILIYGAYLLNNGLNNLSTFVGFISIIGIFEGEMNGLIGFFRQFTNNYAQVLRVHNFFEENKLQTVLSHNKDFKLNNGEIYIKNVSFKYNEKLIFDDFTLKIKGGTKLALVGESGGGKSTLLKLIAGILLPTNGEILIDNVDLNTIDKNLYYKNIGYLSQEPNLFDGSIYENITYSLESNPTEKEINNVLNLCKCEFVYELSNGLQAQIGERGVKLSGGQKQRLAIAKIMLKQPGIILLDEPTSALDSQNEELISIALNNLFVGKTVVICAHRLQTINTADEIIVIDKGKIIERGNNKELIEKGGIYKKMLDLQTRF